MWAGRLHRSLGSAASTDHTPFRLSLTGPTLLISPTRQQMSLEQGPCLILFLPLWRNLTGTSRPKDSSKRKPLSPSSLGWEPTICWLNQADAERCCHGSEVSIPGGQAVIKCPDLHTSNYCTRAGFPGLLTSNYRTFHWNSKSLSKGHFLYLFFGFMSWSRMELLPKIWVTPII